MSLQSRTDEELVELTLDASQGDLRPFDVLVSRHQGHVLANCRYLTRSPDDAEDLAQEVFVKGYFGLSRFEGRSSFKTWIQRIKLNHCLNHLRSKRGKTFVDAQDPAMENEPAMSREAVASHRLESRDEREAVRAVLDSLPEHLRVAVVLRDLDELSYQEISEALEIGLSATKMRIKRGRELFRERFEALKKKLDSSSAPGSEP